MQLGLGITLVQGATPAAAGGPPYTHVLSSGNTALYACSQASTTSNFYSADQTLAVGSFLFLDDALTTPADNPFYSDGTSYYEMAAEVTGEIVAYTPANCASVLLTPILLNALPQGDGVEAVCALGPGETTYYINESAVTLHTDIYGLTGVGQGLYSNGTVYYTVYTGAGDYNGPDECPAPE